MRYAPHRPWWGVWLSALALSAIVAGCAPPVDEVGGTALVPSAEPGTFPVTIDHRYGTTELTEQPERVVALGSPGRDAVLALGARPVGVVDDTGTGGMPPWTDSRWADREPAVVGDGHGGDIERIAALRPDLIIAQRSGLTRQRYERLSRIADVIAPPTGRPVGAAAWPELVKPVGKALGFPRLTRFLLRETESEFARVRLAHPEFGSRTVVVARRIAPGRFAAFTSDDPRAAFLAELGFRLDPRVDDLAERGATAVELSGDELRLLDQDRLVWLTSGARDRARIEADPRYRRLAVHREGRAVFAPADDPDFGAAFSTPTVLSIPHAIERLVPRLAAN
ncbi:ABC transporter substrate-binding protein [Saccharomonospora piscinae]|uniref:ABC transporter substrate-binding protein n=1 Tax=Saccharomonospora piscinae TaxID=687388 RepID=UPI0014238372|nr:ABC transporter substrate-binding protein [Saccharomonospora piscinae]